MKKHFICPYDYEKHYVSDCFVTCSYNSGKKDPFDRCYYGYPKNSEGVVVAKHATKCFKCKHATKYVHCPNVDNIGSAIIPSCCLNSDSLTIALAGAQGSGKSNYIAVLVNEIKKKMSGMFRCSLNIASDPFTKQEYDHMYYNPLFKHGHVVESTASKQAGEYIRPLIFPIDFLKGRLATLTFYDTAGEVFDNNEILDTVNRYISKASGIIMLLDPLQVPSIRKKLEGKMTLPPQKTDAVEILDRIIETIRGKRAIKDQAKPIDIPLAVVVTKIDALEKHGLLNDGAFAALRSESKHLALGKFVNTDFRAVNSAVKIFFEGLLDCDGEFEHEIMTKVKIFTNHAFFGVTALGDIPDGYNISGAIKPRRVLDPFLWFLAQNKYINKLD
jgi:hypothetical protein